MVRKRRKDKKRDKPLRYSGNPVISSTPSTDHPISLCTGSTRLYAIHPVSLWNGTYDSHSGRSGWETASAGQGQTSPRETPSSVCREGQMGERPSMRTVQRAAMWRYRVGPCNLDCPSRKSMLERCDYRYRSFPHIGQGVDMTYPTYFPVWRPFRKTGGSTSARC